MNIALIFPGQGSQYIGMGRDFYDHSELCKHTFETLDEVIGRNLTDIMFSGPIEKLSETVNAQPSIMAVSVAIFRYIEEKNIISKHNVTCVAGHSLGEYSALVVNKSISFEDSIKLLIIRSNAMQESMPLGTGGMAAVIGEEETKIKSVIRELHKIGKLYIANDNAAGQIVISGEMSAIDYFCQNYKELGIKKTIKLPVSAPFHTNLISKASDILESALEDFNFDEFLYPFYSNVTAEKTNVEFIKKLLAQQVVSRVRWRETMQNILKDNIDIFVEIGPGKTLTNLLKRSSNGVNVVSVGKISDLTKLESLLI